MTRFLPRSLFGQTLLILLAGLIVSHAIGSWIYTADREQAVRAVGGFATAQRIANLTRLVQDTPREVAATYCRRAQRSELSVSRSRRSLRRSRSQMAMQLSRKRSRLFLSSACPCGSGRQPRVLASSADGPPFGPWQMMGHGPMMHGFGGFAGFRDLQVAIPLADGQWLSFATALPAGGPAFSSQFLLSMAVMAIIILAVSVWAVRRVTAPLASLAIAAERLGHDVNAPPLPEAGTTETRQAARAFNDMQTRLRNLIENRTRLLAAISHDLRTPLTLLRLRAETVENAQERDKMLSTIAEMDSMIGATLQFARDESASEPRRQTDLTSLLQSVVDDMRDAGLPVHMEPAGPIIYECQPAALKRAVRNLLDNAVKYGKAGSASIRTRRGRSRSISMTKAREFPSRSSHACSSLSTASRNPAAARPAGSAWAWPSRSRSCRLTAARSTLSNRPTGGLRASITLPR